MEPAAIPGPSGAGSMSSISQDHVMREEAPFPISAIQTPSDIDMLGTPAGAGAGAGLDVDEGSDAGEEEDGLFAGGDDEEEESDAMEEVQTAPGGTNGVKRKLVEEDDYD